MLKKNCFFFSYELMICFIIIMRARNLVRRKINVIFEQSVAAVDEQVQKFSFHLN